MNHIPKRKLVSYLTSAVAAAVVCVSGSAGAQFRYSDPVGVQCAGSGVQLATNNQYYYPSTQSATLSCGVITDTAVTTAGATLAIAYGYANTTGSLAASSCVIYAAGGGGACNWPTANSAGGVTAIWFSPSTWNAYPQDYPYYTIFFGPAISGSYNVFWGATFG